MDSIRMAVEGLHAEDKDEEFRLLSKVCHPVNFNGLLSEVLERPEELETMAEKSYRHANGFSKLVLSSSATHSLRLHIYWDDGRDNYHEDVHNHRWDFSSCTLKGALKQEFFKTQPSTTIATTAARVEKLRHYLYEPLAAGDKGCAEKGPRFRTVYIGEEFIQKKGELTTPAGYGYRLRREELHRVCYGSEMTITVVLYTAPYSQTCDLYSDHEQFDESPEQTHKTGSYSLEGIENDLTIVKDLLEGQWGTGVD